MDRILAFPTVIGQRFRGLSFLAASIAIAALAQWMLILSTEQPGFWDIRNWWSSFGNNSSPLPGLVMYAISGWMFIRGINLIGEIPAKITFANIEQKIHSPRFGFWITSLGLAILTASYASSPDANQYGPALAITWLISIGLFVSSVIMDEKWRPPSIFKLAKWLKSHQLDLAMLTIIVSIAFFIRFYGIELNPYSFINDEGKMGNTGSCIADGACNNLFETGWAGQPMLAFLPIGISISIFGHTATAVRTVSILMGTLAVLCTYLLTREIFGQTQAWMAAGLLAALPINVHFSRLGVSNIIDSLSTTAILWLIFRGMKRGSVLTILLAGILAGICFATYPGTRLAPILGLFLMLFITLRTRRFLNAQIHNIVIYTLAFTIVAAPFLGYFWTHPQDFTSRMSSQGIFQNHSFQDGLQSGKNAFEIMTDQFMKSSLVFILTPAPLNFYNSPKPYLVPVAAIFFMLGLFFTIWRIKDERYLALFLWFWAAIILGSTITDGPPSSQRMLMSTPPLAIITALGFSKVIENILQTNQITRWLGKIILILFVLFIGYQNLYFYFYEYQAGHFFEDPANEFTYETASLITPLHSNGRFYVITEPNVPYLSFPNFDFFSPDVEKSYFNDVTPQTVAALPKDKDALFIATPGRKPDIEQLEHLLPGGEWTEVRRRNQPDQVLFYSYYVKKQLFRP